MSNNNEKGKKSALTPTFTNTETTPLLYDAGDSTTIRQPHECWGTRHTLVVLAFIGSALAFCMRVNLSIAIVAMATQPSTIAPTITKVINDTTDPPVYTDTCPYFDNPSATATVKQADFNWSANEQSMILSAFFWGYAVTQIPGGLLAKKYGGKLLLGSSVLLTSFFAVLTPLLAYMGPGYLMAARVFQGLGQGVIFPATHSMLAKWSTPFERSRFVGIIFAGGQAGTVIAMPLSGYLCDSDFLQGWPSAFYLFGIVGFAWFCLWMAVVYDSPEEHPYISNAEKQYIENSLGPHVHSNNALNALPVPWKAIFTSVPMWAILVAHIGQNWGFNTLLTELPIYMQNILHFDIKQNSLLSALPYLCMAIFSPVAGVIADFCLKKGYFSITITRKIFNTIAFWIPAVALIGASYTGCDRVSTVGLLTLAVCVNGACRSGFQTNHLDICPNFAGVVMGITNCAANLASILAPLLVGFLTDDNQTLSQWRLVFMIAALIYFLTNAFYLVFGTGNEQSWNFGKRESRTSRRQSGSV